MTFDAVRRRVQIELDAWAKNTPAEPVLLVDIGRLGMALDDAIAVCSEEAFEGDDEGESH